MATTVAARSGRGREWTALVLIAASPILALALGLASVLTSIAALMLVWQSRRWSVTEKLVAGFGLPVVAMGIYAFTIVGLFSGHEECVSISGGPMHCTTYDPGVRLGYVAGAAACAVVTLAIVVWLVRAMRRPPASADALANY